MTRARGDAGPLAVVMLQRWIYRPFGTGKSTLGSPPLSRFLQSRTCMSPHLAVRLLNPCLRTRTGAKRYQSFSGDSQTGAAMTYAIAFSTRIEGAWRMHVGCVLKRYAARSQTAALWRPEELSRTSGLERLPTVQPIAKMHY